MRLLSLANLLQEEDVFSIFSVQLVYLPLLDVSPEFQNMQLIKEFLLIITVAVSKLGKKKKKKNTTQPLNDTRNLKIEQKGLEKIDDFAVRRFLPN
jgi:hypothetical protein